MTPPWRYLIPNGMTFLVNVLALASLYIAYAHQDRRAAILLLAAGALDACDGVVARKLEAQSRFGNIYDSMSDLLAFGVAPALSLFFLDLLHPLVTGFYILAIQLRLTRYSAAPESETAGSYFRGLASPDAVYMGILFGLIPYSNFNYGFSAVALFAIYPGKLWPKGLRIPKLIVAALTMWAFLAI